jgi:hypothetical protein
MSFSTLSVSDPGVEAVPAAVDQVPAAGHGREQALPAVRPVRASGLPLPGMHDPPERQSHRHDPLSDGTQLKLSTRFFKLQRAKEKSWGRFFVHFFQGKFRGTPKNVGKIDIFRGKSFEKAFFQQIPWNFPRKITFRGKKIYEKLAPGANPTTSKLSL